MYIFMTMLLIILNYNNVISMTHTSMYVTQRVNCASGLKVTFPI